MVTIMDTRDYAPRARSKVWTESFLDAVTPMTVRFEDPEGLSGRMDLWSLGDIDVLRSWTNVGKFMQLTPAQARLRDEPRFSFGLQLASTGLFRQFDTQSKVLPGQVHCVDLSQDFEFEWVGAGSSVAMLSLTPEQLGLPIDTIRRGATRIASSALFPLVSRHAAQALSPGLERDPGAFGLGTATVELFRALLASAARDDRHQRAAMAETLLTRIRAYVHQNLRNRDLTPRRIAAAHHISVRYLYALCNAAEISLEQWIILRRLRGAQQELSSVNSAGRTIGTIAFEWGFSDPAHFSRRFRQEYGVSPREWRAVAMRQALSHSPAAGSDA